MKRGLFVALLALALPMAAFANSKNTIFVAFGGDSTLGGLGTGTGLFDTSSTLTGAMGFEAEGMMAGGNLGSLSFTTGALMSHSGATWTYASGGTFSISGSGGGLPSGTLFTGTFDGPVTLTKIQLANGFFYQLSCETPAGSSNGCMITGTWANGKRASGDFILTTMPGKTGIIQYAAVTLQTSAVPEPGALSLLGTGLLGLGIVVRRKLKA